MKRSHVTKQRSKWSEIDNPYRPHEGCITWSRNVHDGQLVAIVAEEPTGWHLSISHSRLRKGVREPGRYPTWDEIAHSRDELLPSDVEFAMFLPVADEYVAIHDTTFHLHEYPGRNEALHV